MSLAKIVKINKKLMGGLLSVVVPTMMLAPAKPVSALIPGASAMPCSIEREFRPSVSKSNRVQFQIEVPAGSDRLFYSVDDSRYVEGGAVVTIPAQSFTVTLERDRKSDRVILSTSQGHAIALQSSAPLDRAKVWLSDLDTPNFGPLRSEVVLSLPESKLSGNKAVPHSILILKDMQGASDRDPSLPWAMTSLKTITADPQMDFVVPSYDTREACSLVTAESVTVGDRPYWFYRPAYGGISSPTYLPQTGSILERTTPLDRPLSERLLGRFIDRSPELIATVESVEPGSKFGEVQITAKTQKGDRVRVVPTEMVNLCSDTPMEGYFIPNYFSSGRVQWIQDIFSYSNSTIKIYGMQSLPDGRISADLIVAERQCYPTEDFPRPPS